jgi:hypothetical protein
MAALLLTFATLLYLALVGIAVLAAARANTGDLRVALTAPMVGSAMTVLPLFLVSQAGIGMAQGAPTIVFVLAVVSAGVLAWKRPRVPIEVAGVAAICVGGLLLIARPMLEFGLRWIANANGDMANYVLMSTGLLNRGLLAPDDLDAMAANRNFETFVGDLHRAGARPGSDIALAAYSGVTTLAPYELFMSLNVALALGGMSAVAALALQATRRTWAAYVAACLLAISPLATYGVLQQLLPQVWGLALGAALFALLMRPEVHERRPRLGDLVPIGLLATALILVYVEFTPIVGAAYVLYVAILAARRRLAFRSAALLWLGTAATAVVVLQTYLPRELRFLSTQASYGASEALAGSPFAFVLVPAALPGVTGVTALPADPLVHFLDLVIVASALMIVVGIVAAFATAARGVAASVMLVAFTGVAALLVAEGSDFGLFKLFMFIQPFVAAAVAVWLTLLPRGPVLFAAAAGVALLAALQLHTQWGYVDRSRSPIDLIHASDADLLPAFDGVVERARAPIVSATENPMLAKLEAARMGNRSLYFISRKMAITARDELRPDRVDGWIDRRFRVLDPRRARIDQFEENARASKALASGRCVVALQTGSQLVFNRRSLPEGSPDLVGRPCNVPNTLVFVNSDLGQHFYGYTKRRRVSFYQLEQDPFHAGHTFAGFGRYALFRVLNPTGAVRLELSLTNTVRGDASDTLPHASVVGRNRVPLPIVGRGSAAVVSRPFTPQLIAGQPYVLLDLGTDGHLNRQVRSGVAGLYGRHVALDPRVLAAYVRNVSLVSDDAYRRERAPVSRSRFPSDLFGRGLEYSGFYEDGRVAERSYAVLDGRGRSALVLRADVLPRAARRLEVRVDDRVVFSKAVDPGSLDLRIPLQWRAGDRSRVELSWAGTEPLSEADRRPAAALVKFLGFQ